MWAPVLYGLWTTLIANIFSYVFLSEDEREPIRAGLYGFNSFLLGVALPVFLQSHVHDWYPDFQLIFLLFLLPPIAVFIQSGLNKHMVPSLQTPCFTLPFNILTILFLLESERPDSMFKVNDTLIHPSPIKLVSSFPNVSVDDYATAFVPAVFKGPSQVFLIDSTIAGILVLVGVFLYSRISFVMAVAGAIVGYSTSILVGTTKGPLIAGLWAYNSVLTAIAIGGVFVSPNSAVSIFFALIASFFSTLLFGVCQTFLQPWGLPALTLPFCIATIVFMLPQKKWKSFHHIPLNAITYPEEHFDVRNSFVLYENQEEEIDETFDDSADVGRELDIALKL